MKDFVIVFFAEYFGYVLLGILLVLWLRSFKKYLPLFWQIAGAALLSRGIFTELIRFFWHRNRPFVEHNIVPLVEQSASGSFPSGHAALFFAVASVVYLHNKKTGLLFFAGAALIGVARVLANVHWFSDIVGGAVVGILSGVFVYFLSKQLWKNQKY